MSEREEKFEKMMAAVLSRYDTTVSKLEALKAQGKVKTVTYNQLLVDKLKYQNRISLYKIYGVIED